MPTVEINVSLDKLLFEKVDALATEMGLARSQLFALAMEEYIERHETRRLVDQVNATYAEPDPEDEAYLTGMRRLYREALKRDDE